MLTIKIEEGKFYRTRNNKKARIYAVKCCGHRTVHGAILNDDDKAWIICKWQDDGKYYMYEENDFDLIYPWIEDK